MRGEGVVGGRHRRRAPPPEPDRPEKQNGRAEGGQKHKRALVGAADPGTTATGPSGASAAGNGAGRRRRRERRRRRLQHAWWVGDRLSANRRRRSGGLFKIDGLSQIQLTDFVENHRPTARSSRKCTTLLGVHRGVLGVLGVLQSTLWPGNRTPDLELLLAQTALC